MVIGYRRREATPSTPDICSHGIERVWVPMVRQMSLEGHQGSYSSVLVVALTTGSGCVQCSSVLSSEHLPRKGMMHDASVLLKQELGSTVPRRLDSGAPVAHSASVICLPGACSETYCRYYNHLIRVMRNHVVGMLTLRDSDSTG